MNNCRRLPKFNELDVQNWFLELDVLFDHWGTKPLVRFSEAIALLNMDASNLVRDLITNYHTEADPYLVLKEKLCAKLAMTKRERIAIGLSSSGKLVIQTKPSAFVDYLDHLFGDVSMEDLRTFLLLCAFPPALNVRIREFESARGLAIRLDEYYSITGKLL